MYGLVILIGADLDDGLSDINFYEEVKTVKYFDTKKELSFSIYEERILFLSINLYKKLGSPKKVSIFLLDEGSITPLHSSLMK